MVLPDLLIPRLGFSGVPAWPLVPITLGTLLYIVISWPLFDRFLGLGPSSKLPKHFWRRYVFWFWSASDDEALTEDDWPPARCPTCDGIVAHTGHPAPTTA
jgi:hypothetical protein